MSATLLDSLRSALAEVRASPAPVPAGKRRAAVLLLLDPSQPELPLLFVQRAVFLRQHAGQIGFPGGGSEPDDPDPVATAVREAGEEVGVVADDIEVVASLPGLLTAVSNLWLTPVVAVQRRPFEIRGDGYEVAEWFWVSLADLLTASHTVREMERDGRRGAVHFYEVGERIIWGVTAAILHDLMVRLGRQD